MSGCSWEDPVELLLLFADSLDMHVHGNLLGEDNEESPLCRDEKSRFEQTSLSLDLYCFCSIPTFLVAWQHYC